MDGLTVGRMVHYVLSESDVKEIRARRPKLGFVGNEVEAGEHVAMIITKVINDGL